jgi:hypothetical protein
MDFLSWIGERTLGKLFFIAVLALPVLAMFGLMGLLSRKRGRKSDEDSSP